MFQEARRHHHHHHGSHHGKNESGAAPASDDPTFPDQRLEVILKGLEERLESGKDKLQKLRFLRTDLQSELHGLHDE